MAEVRKLPTDKTRREKYLVGRNGPTIGASCILSREELLQIVRDGAVLLGMRLMGEPEGIPCDD